MGQPSFKCLGDRWQPCKFFMGVRGHWQSLTNMYWVSEGIGNPLARVLVSLLVAHVCQRFANILSSFAQGVLITPLEMLAEGTV
jgi:hypothetical protein